MNSAVKSTVIAVVISLSIVLFATPPQRAYADNHCTGSNGSSNFFSFPTWYEYLDVEDDCSVSVIRYTDGSNAVNIGATIGAILLAVIEILLRVAGIVAVGFIIYGGVLLTISQGSPEKWRAALQTLLNGGIGLMIAILAVAIVNLVSNILMG